MPYGVINQSTTQPLVWQVFLCFGVLTGYFALSGLWYGVPMGLLATCVSFSVFQMSSFEGLRRPQAKQQLIFPAFAMRITPEWQFRAC